ncbi:MAG TPA: carboxypeptidase-like regulatory domain-containing protein, partial [Ohtaekwangia sp.]|nr:carboxypeptidase-like regulatory domain-containing protein [Ohtaekwangia sp.]
MMMKIYRNVCVSVVLLMLLATVAYAQQRVITGTVKDETGQSMPGVNVLIKGTTTGTASDAEGNFSIRASDTDVLSITFIGYKSQEFTVGNQTNFDITMTQDLTTLGEVVVVGYGVQEKKVVTAATVNVKGEDLVNTNSLRLEQALQGQTPGVQISATSGQPGESLRVRVRGTGTLGDSEPLYVVDGV